jgi:hypothetical protein
VEALRKAYLHVTDNDQKLIDCMKKIGKLTLRSTLLNKYRVIFVKLYNIDERLVNQFIKAFKNLSELKNL